MPPPYRIGGSIPIVYTYFTEFLQMDKRGEHLSWLCMFWMFGGLYASFTAWGIIPHYGNTQTHTNTRRALKTYTNKMWLWRHNGNVTAA